MNDEAKVLRDKLPSEHRMLFDNAIRTQSHTSNTYISKANYDRQYSPEINIYDCTPYTWNALGGNYEKDVKDPLYKFITISPDA